MSVITRKEFLKKGTVLGMAGALGLSGIGKKTAHAAVLDNTDHNDISKDVINQVTNENNESAFHSGQTAQELAEAVNNLKDLFDNAMTSLKDTEIAKAVNADGASLPELNEQLGNIKAHASAAFVATTIARNEAVEAGYYPDGSLKVDAAEILNDTEDFVDTTPYTLITNGSYDSAFVSTGNDEDPKNKVHRNIVVNVTKDTPTGRAIVDWADGRVNEGSASYSQGVINTKKGTAQATDVRKGKTFTNQENVNIEGTMAEKSGQTYTPMAMEQKIAKDQYLTGDQIIEGDANLVAENIAKGVSIFGISGSFTADANAVAGEIEKDKIAYVDGKKVIGTFEGQEKTVKATQEAHVVVPDQGKYLSKVTVNPELLYRVEGTTLYIETNTTDDQKI